MFNFYSFSKANVVYLRSFLTSLQLSKFWKQNFMYFGHRHVETGPNCSHELATFPKYHMPLIHVLKIGQNIDRNSLINKSKESPREFQAISHIRMRQVF